MILLPAVPRGIPGAVRLSAAVAALLLTLAPASRAQVVQNGTFDVSEPGAFWTAANIDGAGGWRSTGGNPGGMFILNDNGNPATDPTIFQTITGLLPGGLYEIAGDFARVYSTGASAGSFGAAIDGNFIFAGQNPNQTYSPFAFSFTATATSHQLALAGERLGSDVDYSVDNISIRLLQGPGGGVPEPGTLALLSGPALLAVWSVRRRLRRGV